jgi:hypothetical protein
MRSSTDGYTIGPYLAVRLSDHWAIDGSFNYSQTRSAVQAAILSGAATLRAYFGSVNLHGQYTVADWFLRPKLSVSYTHNISSERNLQGTLLGLPISLVPPASQSNYGVADAYQEFSRLFELSNGYYAIPYTELGVHYVFERANGGQILTADFTNVIPTAWSGSLRQGIRMQLPNAALLEASVGYLSLGAPGLNIWEGGCDFRWASRFSGQASFSGHGLEVLTSVCPRKQLVDLTVRMAVGDPGEDVGQVGERIDIVQLTGLDQ